MSSSAPARMRGANDSESPIGEKDWRAVCDSHGNGDLRIIADDDVRWWPRRAIVSGARDCDIGAMNLMDQAQLGGINAHPVGDRAPLALVVHESQIRGREQMGGESRKRCAMECGPPRLLRPLESVARLDLTDEHHRNRIGCH